MLGWLTYYEGPDASGRRLVWWKNANGSLDTVRIAAFILQYELAELEGVRLELQEGAARAVHPINLGAKIIRYDLETNGLNKTTLSRYTAFFDPKPGGGFTQDDWNRRWLKGPISTYVSTVRANSGSPGNVRNWWREWEIRCNRDDRRFEYRYWLDWAAEPDKLAGSGPNDEFFFGTREQFDYHCVGGG